MSIDRKTITTIASELDQCELMVHDRVKITDAYPNLTWDDAYAIQDAIRQLKIGRGARIVGLKAGLTSRAKMRQMGVDTPIFGFLADYFNVPDGGVIDTKTLIHPKVEPEIAFVMKAALKGPGCHIAQVMVATDFVLPAMEVIDSRYRDFKFDLKSVIADNCSASRFVTGGRIASPSAFDLRTLGVVLEKNGEPVGFGAGAAVMGHPAQAVAALANELGRRDQEIPVGSIVLSGGITGAVSAAAGDSFTLREQFLGSVGVRFV